MKEQRSVVDYIQLSRGLVSDRMMVEDSGELNLGSNHNLIRCEVRTDRLEEGTSDPRLKWMVDGKIEWEGYQELMIEDFRRWAEHIAVLWMGKDRGSVQQLWDGEGVPVRGRCFN